MEIPKIFIEILIGFREWNLAWKISIQEYFVVNCDGNSISDHPPPPPPSTHEFPPKNFLKICCTSSLLCFRHNRFCFCYQKCVLWGFSFSFSLQQERNSLFIIRLFFIFRLEEFSTAKKRILQITKRDFNP